jgi:conserved oligomeric Golgi complex subunit 6
LAEVTAILQQRKQVESKQELLSAITDNFVMSEDEVAALTQTAEPVDEEFFQALAKAKKINKDCEVLLGFEKQTLGLDLMEKASKNINLGFQKLYKWIQREFKTLNLENPQMNSSIRRALRVLAERPTLFQNCLDFFSDARERILSDSFQVALTGTSPSGVEDRSVKPIDMTAHDPLRYVGDMLAWIHSAAVGEREALETLFIAEGEELAKGMKSGRSAEIWRLVADDEDDASDFNALKALTELVDRDISGVSHVLRQRVEQVIQSNEEIIPAYKIANLINFYKVTFTKLLGAESGLLESMKAIHGEAMRQFRALVRDQITTVQGEFHQTPSDFGPPGFLQDCLKQLHSFIQTYDSSITASDSHETGFDSVLAEAFDPFIAGCENMAQAMLSPDDSVFIINCTLTATSTLGSHVFTQHRLRQLLEKLDSESKRLIANQYTFFRESSGLEPILALVQEGKQTSAKSIGVARLAQASQKLDDFLPSAMMDALDRLRHLQDSSLARKLTEEAAERFCSDFEQLETVLQRLDSGNETRADQIGELRTSFPRTTAEIRVLLS